MALKRTPYVRTAELVRDNAVRAAVRPAGKDMKLSASEWLMVIATILDSEAEGDLTYVTLGTNRAKDAYMLTVNYPDGTKQYIAGSDVSDLGNKAFLELVEWRAGESVGI